MRACFAVIYILTAFLTVLSLTNCAGDYTEERNQTSPDPVRNQTSPEPEGSPPDDTSEKKMCTLFSAHQYPITKPSLGSMARDRPREGENTDRRSQQCSFMQNLSSEKGLEEMTRRVENHDASCEGNRCEADCDRDCDNRFITELYESYLMKYGLESWQLTNDIIAVHKKIFDALGAETVAEEFRTWVDEESLFPANQKSRDWSLYNKKIVLADLVGVSNDPTRLMLSADFLKYLQHGFAPDFLAKRDYVFNAVQKKARGYRTNRKKGREGKVEKQVGITSFDLDELVLDPRYYPLKNWLHWGRTSCDTSPNQGSYENEAIKNFVPLKCGISGSTNFWIWTALYSGADMSEDEVRLFILSAFLVLGADGGHSLMEVLSSAAMSAVYMKHYEKYSRDPYLTKFINRSNFAQNLYEVTKDINPIGGSDFACIDFEKVATHIFAGDRYQPFADTKQPDENEIAHRKEIESFFLQENNRYKKPFANYTIFLDKIPQLTDMRKKIGKNLAGYVKKYCLPSR